MPVEVIIPYNFTENDKKSIDFVINHYLDSLDVQLTLFHGYTPVPEINSQNNPIMDKMNRAVSHLRNQLKEQEEMLEGVKQNLIEKGFHHQNIKCKFVPLVEDIASDLTLLIKNEHYDAVVFNKTPGNIINYFTRSISGRVLKAFEYNKNFTAHIA